MDKRHLITFIVDGAAVPKQRPRMGGRRAYTPKKTKDYECRVRQSFSDAYHGDIPVYAENTPVRAVIRIIQAVPKSWSKKKREAALVGKLAPTTRNGDLDNIAKSILDALNECVYADDAQVTTLMITKRYGEQPKAIIRFYEDDYEY